MSKLTKKALAQSLKSNLNKIPMKKITVNNIVEECGVNRRTLYYNFKDTYDLLEWTLKNDLHDAIGENTYHANWDKGLEGILLYLYSNKNMIDNIHRGSDGYIEEHLGREVSRLIRRVLEEVSADIDVCDHMKERVTKFYRIALMGNIVDWIECGMKDDPQEIAKSIRLIIDGDIKRALIKYQAAEGAQL